MTILVNYRPIPVAPVLSKILERGLHSQIPEYLEENQLLTDFQFGYRSNRSTTLADTLLMDDIRKVTRADLLVLVLWTLERHLMLASIGSCCVNLRLKGLGGELLVTVESSMALYLFILFFNESVDHIINSRVLKYENNTVIYFAGTDISVIEDVLTQVMEFIAKYFDTNELVINLKKEKNRDNVTW